MIRRSTPLDLESMFDRMARQFDETNRGFETQGQSREGGMPIDLTDEGDAVTVTADLPGYEKEDIGISTADGLLTIRAEREASVERGDEAYVHRERRTQSARRTVAVPVEIDEDAATATYHNGVLSVTLPKVHADEDDDSHSIDIE